MAITAAERQELVELVVLMFNAAPGATYLNSLVNLYEFLGHDLHATALALQNVPQFWNPAEGGVHPDTQSPEDFIEAFLSPLGLQDDAYSISVIEGWQALGYSKAEIIYRAYVELNNVTDDMPAQYVAAKAILENKTAVAIYYSAPPPSGVGVVQTDLEVLQSVLDGVTDNDNTVTTALNEINAGTRGVPGVEFTLDPDANNVDGGNNADLINGVFGDASATYNAGDDIDGGGGYDVLNLVASGTTSSAVIKVVDVEKIAIQDTVGATFDATLVSKSTTADTLVIFTSTLDDKTSNVKNASTAVQYGLAGKGNLTVDFLTTSGTADKAQVYLEGVGTSATNVSTIDVDDGNTIESVSISATGTNFAAIDAGTAAKTITVTGSGTNTLSFTSINTTATIDASASTGTNTFVMGTNLGAGDVIKGGSGNDTVDFSAKSAIGAVTLTGVETLKADIDSNATLNLSGSTGLTTLTFNGGSGNATVTNAPESLTTINITSVAALEAITSVTSDDDDRNDYTIKYASGVTAPVTVNLSATSSVRMNDLTIEGAESLTVNAAADKTTLINDIVLTDDLTALTVTVGAEGYFSAGYVQADGAEDVAFTLTVGDEASAFIYSVSADSFADVAVTVGEDAFGQVYLGAMAGGMGNVVIEVGEDGYFSGGFQAWTSDAESEEDLVAIGNFTVDVAAGASAYMYADAFSGDIGDITVTVADEGYFSGSFSAFGAIDDGEVIGGGNIGNVSMTLTGDDISGYLDLQASAAYYYTYDPQTSGGELTSIGNVSLVISGSDSIGYMDVEADGGSIGDVELDVTGGGATSGYIELYAYSGTDQDSEIATIGTVTMNVGDDVRGEIYARFDGSIGATTVTMGADASGYLDLEGYDDASEIGDVTVTAEEGAYFSGYFEVSGGTIGATTVTVGEDSNVYLEFDTWTYYGDVEDGSTGLVTVNAGAGSNVEVDISGGEAEGVVLSGGEDGSATVTVTGESVASIDLSGWMGSYTIDVSGVEDGVTAVGGADGGTITGTDEADQLTGGAGADVLNGGDEGDVLLGAGGNDQLNGQAGNDQLDGGAGNDQLVGGEGNDSLAGGDGNDVLDGGTGNDSLTGSAGNDTYVYATADDSSDATVSGTTNTTITEAAGDVITGDIGDKVDLAGTGWADRTGVTVLTDGSITTATYATAELDAFVYKDGSNYYLAYETAAGTAGTFGTLETVQLVGVVDANDTFSVSDAGVVTFTAVA